MSRLGRPARCVLLALVLAAASASPAAAQWARHRLEIGGDLSTLQLGPVGATNVGVGGRLTFDLTPGIAFEAETSFTPKDVLLSDAAGAAIAHERRRLEVFAGTKIGIRMDRFGFFGKVRPGLTRLSHTGMNCVGDVCALMLFAVPVYRTEFAMDIGGVAEYYPSRRTVARVDIGSTVIRHRSSAPPCGSGGCTTGNFTSRVGFGFRF